MERLSRNFYSKCAHIILGIDGNGSSGPSSSSSSSNTTTTNTTNPTTTTTTSSNNHNNSVTNVKRLKWNKWFNLHTLEVSDIRHQLAKVDIMAVNVFIQLFVDDSLMAEYNIKRIPSSTTTTTNNNIATNDITEVYKHCVGFFRSLYSATRLLSLPHTKFKISNNRNNHFDSTANLQELELGLVHTIDQVITLHLIYRKHTPKSINQTPAAAALRHLPSRDSFSSSPPSHSLMYGGGIKLSRQLSQTSIIGGTAAATTSTSSRAVAHHRLSAQSIEQPPFSSSRVSFSTSKDSIEQQQQPLVSDYLFSTSNSNNNNNNSHSIPIVNSNNENNNTTSKITFPSSVSSANSSVSNNPHHHLVFTPLAGNTFYSSRSGGGGNSNSRDKNNPTATTTTNNNNNSSSSSSVVIDSTPPLARTQALQEFLDETNKLRKGFNKPKELKSQPTQQSALLSSSSSSMAMAMAVPTTSVGRVESGGSSHSLPLEEDSTTTRSSLVGGGSTGRFRGLKSDLERFSKMKETHSVLGESIMMSGSVVVGNKQASSNSMEDDDELLFAMSELDIEN